MPESEVQRAVKDLSPGLLAMAAWGLVTGLAMVESGLSTAHAVGMSLLVYAGAAQLASLPLIAAGAPLVLIWMSALVINLRFAIFAVGQQSWMSDLPRAARLAHGYFTTDILAVLSAHRAQAGWPARALIRYFRTGALLCWATWQTSSMAGIFLASYLRRGASGSARAGDSGPADAHDSVSSSRGLCRCLSGGLCPVQGPSAQPRPVPRRAAGGAGGGRLSTTPSPCGANAQVSEAWTWVALVGLGLSTLVMRSGPLWLERPLQLTEAQRFALQMAPIGALAAIVAPTLLMTDGAVTMSLQDPRLWAVASAIAARLLGRGLLTILLVSLLAYGLARLILAS
ncbi:MAG: hypothetical protein EBR88_06055 [Betaproteobacteria bacterium]|nr:hypothetical protein [Betaproteobacteria bacterium]